MTLCLLYGYNLAKRQTSNTIHAMNALVSLITIIPATLSIYHQCIYDGGGGFICVIIHYYLRIEGTLIVAHSLWNAK